MELASNKKYISTHINVHTQTTESAQCTIFPQECASPLNDLPN